VWSAMRSDGMARTKRGGRTLSRVRDWLVNVAWIGLVLILSISVAPAATSLKQITVLVAVEPKSLDLSVEDLNHDLFVDAQVNDNMVGFTNDLKQDPRLALSWRNIDKLTWEVKLRQGVKFSNGEPFNADAVLENFKYLTRDASALKTEGFEPWDRIERVNDYTVRVKTKVPNAEFLLGLFWLHIYPPGVLKSDPGSLSDRPIGTGPYKVVDWVKGERIVLEANDSYWRGRVKIDRVTFRFVPEASARVSALLARQADLIIDLPPESIGLVNKNLNTKAVSIAGLRSIDLVYDTRTPPFNDVRVRQALNYAVDKQSIIKNILGGRALIQATPSHPLTFGHSPDVKPYPYDPQRAKRLLAQAGYPNGLKIDFHYPTGRWLKDVEVAQSVGGMLKKVGVNANLITMEYGGFFSAWLKKQWKGMSMLGTENFIDSDQVVQLFLYSKGALSFSYTDRKLDAMYEQDQREFDVAKRRQLLHEMEAYISKQAPWLFLYFQPQLYGINSKLKWDPPANELMLFWDAELK